MLQESTTDMSTTQSKYDRRFDEEFEWEVAALAGRPGARQEQVTRDLGVSPYSVSRWKKLYGSGPAVASPTGVNVAPDWSGASKHLSARTRTCASSGRS